MTDSKFELGDSAIITGNGTYHDFPEGAIVQIVGGPFERVERVEGYRAWRAQGIACTGAQSVFVVREDDMAPLAYSEDKEEDNDPVNHPKHYNQGGIELLDILKAYHPKEYTGFLLCNVIKYTLRAGHKEKTKSLIDFEKAQFYLNLLVEELKKQ